MTPGGIPASANSSADSNVDAEANSDGLTMTALPAARAVASLGDNSSKGEFHGVMSATTPSGSWRVNVNILALPVGITEPSILSASPARERSQSAPRHPAAAIPRAHVP